MPTSCLAYHFVENEDLFSSLIYLTTGALSAFHGASFDKLIFDLIRRRKFYRFFATNCVQFWAAIKYVCLFFLSNGSSSGWKQSDVSWVVSTPRFPAPASGIHLAHQVWERRSVRPSHTLPFAFNPGDATGTQGIGVWSAKVCWLPYHLSDHFVSQ